MADRKALHVLALTVLMGCGDSLTGPESELVGVWVDTRFRTDEQGNDLGTFTTKLEFKEDGTVWLNDVLLGQFFATESLITITDAEQFYETYYVPSNLVTTIVGDVKAEEVIPVLDKYFGRIPAGPDSPVLRTVRREP